MFGVVPKDGVVPRDAGKTDRSSSSLPRHITVVKKFNVKAKRRSESLPSGIQCRNKIYHTKKK